MVKVGILIRFVGNWSSLINYWYVFNRIDFVRGCGCFFGLNCCSFVVSFLMRVVLILVYFFKCERLLFNVIGNVYEKLEIVMFLLLIR